MKQSKPHLLTIDLSAFGEGAAAGEGGAPEAAETHAAPETRGEKQPEQTAALRTDMEKPETAEKRKAFRALISGAYKEQYTEETQKLINRRFRESETLRQAHEKTRPLLDYLASRYGAAEPEALLEALRAEEDGAAREAERLRQETQAMHFRADSFAEQCCRRWLEEAEQLAQRYPEFSLDEMQRNRVFTLLLGGGVPMEQAYRAAAVETIERQAAAGAEKAVTANIRARGSRPEEAGAAPTPAFGVKETVSNLSDREVLEILARISSREKITFG